MRFVSGLCSRCVSMLAVAVLVPVSARSASPDSDPLPSWNEGAAKRAIVEFVARVTDAGSPDHVPAAERVAVFDNDGTLWPEYPLPYEAGLGDCVCTGLASSLTKGCGSSRRLAPGG
jgi:hypothetical protein